jgi:V/A-type H+-transporting ATPase subunit D
MISPTRMNLITIKKRIVMANKGHNVLKRKREVLVLEFLRLLKDSRQDRSYLNKLMQDAYKSVTIASTYIGDFELESAAAYVPEMESIGITLKGVMGVQIPEILKKVHIEPLNYNILSLSIAVDDVTDSFTKTLETVVNVAQRELGLKRLVIEIEKTKRRVNSLEYIVIPKMQSNVKYISMRLNEMDRDTFAGLKHVKKKLARRQNA